MDNRKTIREQRDDPQWGFWLVILAVDLGLAYLWMYGRAQLDCVVGAPISMLFLQPAAFRHGEG